MAVTTRHLEEFIQPPAFPPAVNLYSFFDFPNPRGYQYPSNLRTFTQSTNIQLIGLDKVYGAAGQTKTFDWTNPILPRYAIDLKTWINPLSLELLGQDKFFGPPGYAPTYDWPVPKGYQFPLDGRTFLVPPFLGSLLIKTGFLQFSLFFEGTETTGLFQTKQDKQLNVTIK